jgi:hypothetical protein
MRIAAASDSPAPIAAALPHDSEAYVFVYRSGTQLCEVSRRRRKGVSVLLALSTEKA